MDQDINAAFSKISPERETEPVSTTEALQARAASIHLPVRPWMRLLARSFDILLFSVTAEALAAFLWPEQQTGHFLLFGLVPGILLYFLFDALLMAAFGTTPGKRLLKISVVPDNWHNMTLRESLRRSFNVGWRGLAFGLPIINFISLYQSRKRLLEKGKTQWDEKGHYYVFHDDIGVVGPLALIFFSALLLLIGSILSFLRAERSQGTLLEYRTVEKLPSILSAPSATLANSIAAGQAGKTSAGQKTRQILPHLKIPHTEVARSKAHREEQDATEVASVVFAELNAPTENALDKHLHAATQKVHYHLVRHHLKKVTSSVRRSSYGHKNLAGSNKKQLVQGILSTGVSTNHQNSSHPVIHLKRAFVPVAGTYPSSKFKSSANHGTEVVDRNPISATTENSLALRGSSEIGSAPQTDKSASQTNASDTVSSNETRKNNSEQPLARMDSGDRATQISDGAYAALMGSRAPVGRIDSGTPGSQANSGAPVVRKDDGAQVSQIDRSSPATQADGGASIIEINDGAISKQVVENGGAQSSIKDTREGVTLSLPTFQQSEPTFQQSNTEQSMSTRQQDSTAVLDNLTGQSENNGSIGVK